MISAKILEYTIENHESYITKELISDFCYDLHYVKENMDDILLKIKEIELEILCNLGICCFKGTISQRMDMDLKDYISNYFAIFPLISIENHNNGYFKYISGFNNSDAFCSLLILMIFYNNYIKNRNLNYALLNKKINFNIFRWNFTVNGRKPIISDEFLEKIFNSQGEYSFTTHRNLILFLRNAIEQLCQEHLWMKYASETECSIDVFDLNGLSPEQFVRNLIDKMEIPGPFIRFLDFQIKTLGNTNFFTLKFLIGQPNNSFEFLIINKIINCFYSRKLNQILEMETE